MKILVLGATGMAGHMISFYLGEVGYNVTTFTRNPFRYYNNIVGDATDFMHLRDIVNHGEYDVIVNAIGILNHVAEADKPLAITLNSYLPHFLSRVTQDMGTRIIHLSTDCVFSGKIGGYIETAVRDGITFYDRTKALGELENEKDLTFRMSIIGPDISQDGIGLFNWFMKQQGKVNGFTKAIWTGVTTLTLARAIHSAIDSKLTGLYHLVNNSAISKYDLLVLFNKYMRDNQITIVPSEQLVVDKSLINTRTDFSFQVPSYEEMVIDMRSWIENHKTLYPHYSLK